MPRPRRSRLGALAALMAVAALVASAALVLGATKQVDIKEVNDRYHFQPATITVTVGDTVHWKNGSDAPHTADSDDGTTFDGDIDADTGSFDWTADTAGTFAYHCDIHDYMHGTIVVNAAGGATQPPTDTVTGPSGDGSGGTPFAFLLLVALAAGTGGLYALRRLMAVSDDTRD